MEHSSGLSAHAGNAWLTKVPAITAIFWTIKILSTTVGETFADYLAVGVGLGPAVTDALMMSVLAVALIVQFRTRRYTPWIYWSCVVLVSIVGTQITDFFTDTLGVSLYISTTVFAVILAVVFAVWYRQERTLAITSIDTPRREAFYWGAILTTFALGTAAGDRATEALSLGFRTGTIAFATLILVAFAARRAGAGAVATFWIAYVLTRPLGASLGDLLTQARQFGGLDLGASTTSLLFFTVIVVLTAREQLLANRLGVASKDDGPIGGHRADYTWAGTATLAIVLAGASLSIFHPTGGTTASEGTVAVAQTGTSGAHPTTKLGDLTSFAAITADLQTKVTAHDLAGGKTRAKDLEVAWDDAEAGLKPRDPTTWHELDSKIDAVLTALRAGNSNQADCTAALTALADTLNTFNGV